MSKEERRAYEDSLKYYRDLKNSLDTAEQDGYLKAEGQLKPLLEEAFREREEAFREKEEATREKEEAFREKEEATREKEEAFRQKEEAVSSIRSAIRNMHSRGFSIEELGRDFGISAEQVEEYLK